MIPAHDSHGHALAQIKDFSPFDDGESGGGNTLGNGSEAGRSSTDDLRVRLSRPHGGIKGVIPVLGPVVTASPEASYHISGL